MKILTFATVLILLLIGLVEAEEYGPPFAIGGKWQLSKGYNGDGHTCDGNYFNPKSDKGNPACDTFALDFAPVLESDIIAIADGQLIIAKQQGNYGNTVLIKHDADIYSRYAHLSEFSEKIKECAEKKCLLKKGDVIGVAGKTGNSTGVHLHFVMYEIKKEKGVDVAYEYKPEPLGGYIDFPAGDLEIPWKEFCNNQGVLIQGECTDASMSDLLVKASIADSNLQPQEKIQVSATVRNQGKASSEATILHYYISDDSIKDANDNEVGNVSVPVLDVGSKSQEYKYDVTAPKVPKEYWLFACVSPVSNESNTQNNCSLGAKFIVSKAKTPELSLFSFNIDPRRILKGIDYIFSCAFKNQGDDISTDDKITASLHIGNTQEKYVDCSFKSGDICSIDYKYQIPDDLINNKDIQKVAVFCSISVNNKKVARKENEIILVDTEQFPKPKEYPVPTSQDDIRSGDRISAQCDIKLYDCETGNEVEKIAKKDDTGIVQSKMFNFKGNNGEWLKVSWNDDETSYCSLKDACSEDISNNVRNSCYFKDYKGKKIEVMYDFVNCRTYDNNWNTLKAFKIEKGSTGYAVRNETIDKLNRYDIVWSTCKNPPCPSSCWAAEYDANRTKLLAISDDGYDNLAYKQSIYESCNLRIIDGYDKGRDYLFKPENHLSRAEVSKIIVNALKNISDGTPKFEESNTYYHDTAVKNFNDISNDYDLAKYIGKLSSSGIVEGYPPDKNGIKNFGINDDVKHGELAKFIVNAILLDSSLKSWSRTFKDSNQSRDSWKGSLLSDDEKQDCVMDCPDSFYEGKTETEKAEIKKKFYCSYFYKIKDTAMPIYNGEKFINILSKEEAERAAKRGETMKSIYDSIMKRKKKCDLLQCGKNFSESCEIK